MNSGQRLLGNVAFPTRRGKVGRPANEIKTVLKNYSLIIARLTRAVNCSSAEGLIGGNLRDGEEIRIFWVALYFGLWTKYGFPGFGEKWYADER